MKALVTRPREDAGPLVEALRQRGIDAAVEPLLQIRMRDDAALDLDGVQALLFTSANGARAAASATANRDLPVFAVGDATAEEARRLGWTQVESAGGNVNDLARLVAERVAPEKGALLHVAGSVVAGDLVRLLGGHSVRRAVLYDADPVESFSPEGEALLRDGALDFALFFSPRTAARFAELVQGVPARLERTTALCLSSAVAAKVRNLGWQAIRVAEAPTQASLLAALDAVLAGRHDPGISSKGEAMSEPASAPSAAATEPKEPEKTEAAPAAAQAREARASRGGLWPIIALVLVLAAVAAAPFIAPALPWGPKPGSAISPEEIRALSERVAALDERAAALERRGETPTVSPEIEGRLARLEEQLGRLEQRPAASVPPELVERVQRLEAASAEVSIPPDLVRRIEALEQRPQASPEGVSAAQQEAHRAAGEVQALQQRLAALEAEVRQQASADRTDQALLLAVTRLRQSAATSRSFAAELGAALALAQERPELAAELRKLEAAAEKGVPTVAMLRQEFDAVAAEIVRADDAPAPEGWADEILAKVRGLVTIRRVGKATVESGTEAAVANAEEALAEGDLGAAVAALETLEGEAAKAAEPWLAEARRRLGVEAALGAAEQRLVARLAADGRS
jgi:uroporphyrinogen-III synthase